MYAVIETGGKQYRVELGTEIAVDRLDVEPGQTIDLERVLLVADGDEAAIGQPLVEGAKVSADVVRQDRGEKLIVFKYKPKARSRVKKGARAELTILRIAEIAWGGRSAAAAAATAAAAQKGKAEDAARAAAARAAADAALAGKLAGSADAAEAAPAKKAAAKKAAPAEGAEKKTAAKPKTTAAKAADAATGDAE